MDILFLDHKDNNARNNPRTGSNWQLLCRPHNHLKNPRGRGKYNPMRDLTVEDLRTSLPQSAEMLKNQYSEPMFIEWLRTELEDIDEMDINDAINSGAYVADCSTKTIQRYINKYASRAGELILDRERKTIRKRNRDDDESINEPLPESGTGPSGDL